MSLEPDQKKYILLLTLSVTFLLLIHGIAPPLRFASQSIVEVREGVGLLTLSKYLEEERIIRSPLWFRSIAILLGGERRMMAGEYYFERPLSAISVAWRILHGIENVESVKLTVPEGFTKEKISNLFDERFSLFDKEEFLASAPEGFLFPDTYFVPVTATASTTIKMMRDNFDRKTASLSAEVSNSKHSLEEIVIMASLIEGETNNQIDREMVSSILWRRFNIGMPLQVDVERVTYEFRGLPDKAINNPGLASIQASLRPTTTPYLYYLTGNDGKMHYAKTFDEHKENIRKYLSK